MNDLRITRKPESVFYKDVGGKANYITVEFHKTGRPDTTLALVLDDGTDVTRLLELIEFDDSGGVVTVRFRVTKVSKALEGSHFRLKVGDYITDRIKVLSKKYYKTKRSSWSDGDSSDSSGSTDSDTKRLKPTLLAEMVIDNRALKLKVELLETQLKAVVDRGVNQDPLMTYAWDQFVVEDLVIFDKIFP